jgi:hypothetical protein
MLEFLKKCNKNKLFLLRKKKPANNNTDTNNSHRIETTLSTVYSYLFFLNFFRFLYYILFLELNKSNFMNTYN